MQRQDDSDARLRENDDYARALCAARAFAGSFGDTFTRANADDIAQDAVIRVWQRRATLRDHDRLEAFVRTVCKRVRHRAIERDARLRPVSLDAEVGLAEGLTAPQSDVLHHAVAGHAVSVSWCVGELPGILRGLDPLNGHIVRDYYEGFSCRELAERYGLPLDSVKVRLHRSRRRIRRAFEDRVGDASDAKPIAKTPSNHGRT